MMGLLSALPGAVAQGLIWAIMALGVYITYKILDIADLTVDGSICTGAAVCAVMILSGCPVWLSMLCAALSGVLAGLCTGLLHIALGIPALLSGILTVAIPAALGVLIALNWETVFVLFHKIVFHNNYWIFDAATDPVITILPDTFFMHCALMILALVVLGSIICLLAYRHAKHKKTHTA